MSHNARSSFSTTLIFLILCITGGLVYLNAANDPNKIEPRPIASRGPLTSEEHSTISIFEQSKQSVVFISTKQRVRDFWDQGYFLGTERHGIRISLGYSWSCDNELPCHQRQ